jgi:hypothetical protein
VALTTSAKGLSMDTTNTTVYEMTVAFHGKSYRPIIRVADNGVWDILCHEEMKRAMDDAAEYVYSDWLIDFWQARRVESDPTKALTFASGRV